MGLHLLCGVWFLDHHVAAPLGCCVPHTGRILAAAEWGALHVHVTCGLCPWLVEYCQGAHFLAPLMQLPRYIAYGALEVDVVPVRVAGWLL